MPGRGIPSLRFPWRRALADRAGTAVIEFALTAPVFLLFLIGIVEGGRALWSDNVLQYAMQQSGRYIIANPSATDAQIQSYAVGQLPSVDPSQVTVTVTRDAVSGVNFVTVNASYAFAPVTSLVPLGTITLTGKTRVPLT